MGDRATALRKVINPSYEPKPKKSGSAHPRQRPKDAPWMAVRFLDPSDRNPDYWVHSTVTSTLGFTLATLWTAACAAYFVFVRIVDALRDGDLGDGQRLALQILALAAGLYFASQVWQRLVPNKIEPATDAEPISEPPAEAEEAWWEPAPEPHVVEPTEGETEPRPGEAMAPTSS